MSEHGKNNQAHSGVAVDSDGLLMCPFCGSSAREEQTRGSFGGYKADNGLLLAVWSKCAKQGNME